jgi:hypothetical protein
MRNIYKTCFNFLLLLFLTFSVKSQVSIYAFSQYTTTYNSITGGTVFGNVFNDDQVFVNPAILGGQGVGVSGPGFPIGFTFTMNGIQFDRLGINSNGFIMLGTSSISPFCESALSNAYLPIAATSTVLPIFQHKIVAFGHDIQGQTSASSSELRMQTIGTAPNRTVVVQWKNYRKYNNTGDDFNFQIRLMETSNIIEVHYGNFVNNINAGQAQVGLRGALSNDFNSRFINAISSWVNSTPGTSANTIANFNVNLLPSNGLVYRWTPPPICSGTPYTNTVLASPLVICPGGSSTLALAGTYTNSGISYQWQSSTSSSTGPFTPISNGGVPIFYANNIAVNTWYQCAINCAGSGLASTTPPIQVQTTGNIISNVPYTEDFEGIIVNNQLPNCSWASTNPTVICQTYTSSNTNNRVPRSGYGFAAFRYGTQANGDFFYTNGIQLNSGVTYSVSSWYLTDATPGWNYLSLMVGPNQSTTGLVAIATITNTFNSIIYQPLSNTLTVSNSGVYYLALRASGNNSTYYMCIDDISITAPCNLNGPNPVISVGNSVICSGEQTSLSISGGNTYTWSTASNSPSITVMPSQTATYTAVAMQTITGCAKTVSAVIQVNPTPYVSIFASPLSVCSKSAATLSAFGADTYTWSTGSNSYSTIVNPTVATTYSVIGTNTFGCNAGYSLLIGILPSPTISALASPNQICVGETLTLSAFGGVTYFWTDNKNFVSKATNYVIKPNSSTNFTLTGANANGCESTAFVSLLVNACTSIENNIKSENNFFVQPNPFTETLKISTNSNDHFDLRLFDSTGKIILNLKNVDGYYELKNNLSPGLYFVEIKTIEKHQVFKVIKQ